MPTSVCIHFDVYLLKILATKLVTPISQVAGFHPLPTSPSQGTLHHLVMGSDTTWYLRLESSSSLRNVDLPAAERSKDIEYLLCGKGRQIGLNMPFTLYENYCPTHRGKNSVQCI